MLNINVVIGGYNILSSYMNAKTKIILLNITILTVVLIFQQLVSDFMQHFMVIFAVAIVYPLLSSLMLYFDKNPTSFHYTAPIISLMLGYFIFWIGSDFITWYELIIGIVLGMFLYTLEIMLFKRSSFKKFLNHHK